MFRKKWLRVVLFNLTIAGLTTAITAKIVSDIYEKEIADYIGILNSPRQVGESAEPPEEGIEKVFVGVVIADKNLSGDEKKDRAPAQENPPKKRNWTYIMTKCVDGHSVFIFEAAL